MINLHSGGALVTREQLQAIPTPPSDGRWYPVPHKYLLDCVTDTFFGSGFDIAHEFHAVGWQGNRYFGVMELVSPRTDFAMVLGLRNTHDRTFGASIAVGSQVFVCSNLAFSGDIKLSRKHTLNIERDLPSVVHKALGAFKVQQHALEQRYDTYKETEIDRQQADHAIMEMVRGRVIMPSQVGFVDKEWRCPSYEEHTEDGHSVWRLFNAVTHTMKGTPFFSMPSRSAGLHNILDGVCERIH